MEKLIFSENVIGYQNISDELGYILIMPPSTGSRTAIEVFKYFPFSTYEVNNRKIKFLKNGPTHVHNPFLFDGHEKYKLIMTCRNPYTTWVSRFKRNVLTSNSIRSNFNIKKEFSNFIMDLIFHSEDFKENLKIERNFIRIEKEVTYFLRLENLFDDYLSLPFMDSIFLEKDKLKSILSNSIGKMNTGEISKMYLSDDWKDYYDESTSNLVYGFFEKEFSFYGYNKLSFN